MHVTARFARDRSPSRHDAAGGRRGRLRTAAAAAVLLATCVALLSVAQATPPVETDAVVLADGRLPFGERFVAWRNAVEIDELTIRPGGHTGWHSREGPVLLLVKKGTVTNYVSRLGRCVRTELTVGQSLTEPPGQPHLARNESGSDVVVIAVNNYSQGGPTAVDTRRPPACRV